MSRTAAVETVAASAAAPLSATRRRLATVLASHTAVDVYSAYLPPLLGLLEVRCRLSAAQTAFMLGFGSLTSGLAQPLAAWLSDRIDSRLFGALGLVLAAVCLSCLGDATSFTSLLALYGVGMVGVGIFHPVGASSVGQIAERGGWRSLGVSLFFVAGMAGGVTGAFLAPHLASRDGGFELLRYTMIPGLLLAGLLHLAIARVPHRHHEHHRMRFDAEAIRRRWRAVAILYLSNAMRFTVNMALFYLFIRWAQGQVAAANPTWAIERVAAAATVINGDLVAMVILGMAVGGLLTGWRVRAGREKLPMVLIPLLLAPSAALFGVAGVGAAHGLAVLSGVGFAATIPVALSTAQRLLPHRTSLASGLMLGGAWAPALLGPALAELLLSRTELGLAGVFALTGGLLAAAGLVCLALPSRLLADTAARTMPPR